jgi:hypothetical protein
MSYVTVRDDVVWARHMEDPAAKSTVAAAIMDEALAPR